MFTEMPFGQQGPGAPLFPAEGTTVEIHASHSYPLGLPKIRNLVFVYWMSPPKKEKKKKKFGRGNGVQPSNPGGGKVRQLAQGLCTDTASPVLSGNEVTTPSGCITGCSEKTAVGGCPSLSPGSLCSEYIASASCSSTNLLHQQIHIEHPPVPGAGNEVDRTAKQGEWVAHLGHIMVYTVTLANSL